MLHSPMTFFNPIIITLMALFAVPLMAAPKLHPKVIYGSDDRMDIYQSSDNLLKELTKSTAALIPNTLLIQKGDTFHLSGKTLKETGVCPSERFSDQFTSADCSGFLIGSDILVSAGHCIQSMSDCKDNFWVFDYSLTTKETSNGKSSFRFSKNQLYRCTAILAHSFGSPDKSDYSILKLDRVVLGREALRFRKSGKIDSSTSLAVLGHPSGLPSKITTSIDIRDNQNAVFFTINSDTYTGNSGGAVVDSQTGLVEGILIRGDVDYIQSKEEACRVSKINESKSGRGEDVMRINAVVIPAIPFSSP